jgi:hypothetical protein
VAVLEELDERLICSIRVFAVFTVALPSLKDLPSKLGAGYFYPDTILFLVDGDTSSVASPLPSLEARVGGSVPVDFNLRERALAWCEPDAHLSTCCVESMREL